MKKMHAILLIIGAFVIGGAGGAVAMAQLNPHKTPATDLATGAPATANQNVDKRSGLGMTPPEMLEALKATPSGEEYDWQYLNYITSLRNNEVGMARDAAQKATKPEIKQVANEQIGEGTRFVDEMYARMGEQAFSHH